MFGINKATKNATTGIKGKARKLILAIGGLGLAGVLMGAAPAMNHDGVEARIEPGVVVEYHHHHHRIWVPAHYKFRTHYVHGVPVIEQVFVPGHFIWRS